MSFSQLQNHMARYGYELIETPVIEPATLFLTKAGDEIINRLFTFERSGKVLALRPEFTASAAQRYVNGNEKIARWQFAGAIFEDHPGGQYQHFSIGAELIGLAGSSADAEIIGMAALGLPAQPQVIIGHVGLMRHLLQSFNLDERTQRFLLNHRSALKNQGKTSVIELLNHYLPVQEFTEVETGSKTTTEQMLGVLLGNGSRGTILGGRTRDEIVQRLFNKQQRAANRDQILAAIDFLEAWAAIQGTPEIAFEQIEAFIQDDTARNVLKAWRDVIELLGVYGVTNILIKPDLERTWDYYTGIVFEFLVNGKVVGAGGRYDELTQLLGGQENTPAVGFTYYVDALDTLNEKEKLSLTLHDEGRESLQWALKLREAGLTVELMPDTGNLQVTNGQLNWNGKTYSSVESLLTDLKQ